MHPNVAHILALFDYKHLPPHLSEVSQPFAELAQTIADRAVSPEATVALRKLLESKDAAVRDVVVAARRESAPRS
tara:strand:- start:261 stop:485 length:225 start_codon:yes stop_codon:yes gene_type:complete